jgi:hypothetical protein
VYNAFPSVHQTIWTESASFLPKVLALFFVILSWRLFKGDRVRGVILQFGLWSFFLVHVSLFMRFQQNCEECSQIYNILGSIVAVIFLTATLYFIYRLWRVLALNKHYFEDSSVGVDVHSIKLEKMKYRFMPCVFEVVILVYKILTVLFFPVSDILSFLFSRLCEVDSPSVPPLLAAPPITPFTPPKSHKYQPDCSVESFFGSSGKKDRPHRGSR